MADFQLKDRYNKSFYKEFVKLFQAIYTEFDGKSFQKKIFDKEWEARSLKERMRHTTLVLHEFLPANFKKASKLLISLAKELKKQEIGKELEYLFLPDYIEQYGLEDLKTSTKALAFITPISTAEFAVRPFIEKYPKEMMAQMLEWSNHKNEHIRRLASEGCRPRLPWGGALNAFKKNPKPILPILENLKTDESEYVRRSVANNLNDIAKDHPELVLKIAKKWKGISNDTDRLVKHALRTLLKRGNTQALVLFGFADPKRVSIHNLAIEPNKIKIGGHSHFTFDLKIEGKKSQKLRLEYGIHYVKSNGSTSRKIFQLSEKEYEAGKTHSLKRKQHFQELTTRKHYPGEHQLDIIVNGKTLSSVSFLVS